MGNLPIDFACYDYDRVRPLRDKLVQPEGMELNFIAINHPPEIFWRMAMHGEFDVSEMSLGSYVAGRSRKKFPFIAIPVFVSRKFRHAAAYVNVESGIERPEDLKGRRVGVPEYQMTAVIWLRGILQDDYGVHPRDLHWFSGGLEESGRQEKVPLDLPADIRLEPIAAGKSLSRMLVEGEIDALLSAQVPRPYGEGSPKVKRLFPNYREVEMDYYRRTGIFPIMHTVVIREELYERHRWMAQSLFKALLRAKRLCVEFISRGDALQYILPWGGSHLEETRELMGSDFWPYGIEANRKTLETFLRYTHEQSIAVRRMAVEELFARETLDPART